MKRKIQGRKRTIDDKPPGFEDEERAREAHEEERRAQEGAKAHEAREAHFATLRHNLLREDSDVFNTSGSTTGST